MKYCCLILVIDYFQGIPQGNLWACWTEAMLLFENSCSVKEADCDVQVINGLSGRIGNLPRHNHPFQRKGMNALPSLWWETCDGSNPVSSQVSDCCPSSLAFWSVNSFNLNRPI
jgi:hypothetical protein